MPWRFLYHTFIEDAVGRDREGLDRNIQKGPGIARSKVSEMVGAQGYCSDYYKEWELRKELWSWMTGEKEPVPAGAFKDMIAILDCANQQRAPMPVTSAAMQTYRQALASSP